MPSGTVFYNFVKKRMAVKTAPVQLRSTVFHRHDDVTRVLRNAFRRGTDSRVDEFLAHWTGERLGRMSTSGEQLLATATTWPDVVAIFQVEERQLTMMKAASCCVLKIWCRRRYVPMLFKFDPGRC